MNGRFPVAFVLSVSGATMAHAQAANSATPPATPGSGTAASPADDGGDKAGRGSEIVVTGSRVITNGNNSPTPVTVVNTSQLLTVQPSTVVDAVNLMPALQGSQSTTSSPGGGQRNGAGAYINLRAMGDLRTLVLLDGNRVVPTINQMNANVDSWVIPQLLIKRVDVVTGGVSAVYGSDAVSGVVNFITDRGFSGLKVQASSGISNYGDDRIVDLGAAFGTKIDDRGHIEFSIQYRNDPGILDQTLRPFFAKSLGGGGLGTAASPYYNALDQRISNVSFGGLINNGPLAGLQFAQDGLLSTFVHGASTGTSNVESGGDGAWYKSASIKSSLRLIQGFGRLDYDLGDKIHFFLQGSYTDDHTSNSYRAPLEAVNIGYNNPYLATLQPQYQTIVAAQLAASPTGNFAFRRLIDIPATANQYTKTYIVNAGLEGSLGDYKWTLNASRSRSDLRAVNEANVDQGKFFAAANAVRNSSGQIVCNAAQTNAVYSDCVPINLFGPTSITPAALNYILAETWNHNVTKLTQVSGSVTGAPFSTWAGPVNMALSGEWRRETWDVTSNAGPNDPINCGGIQFSCTATTARWLQNTMPALPRVSQTVGEIAYEVDLPLAKDSAFAQSLNLNGAARYTDYSTSGSVWTWKAGVVWRPIRELTIRGTISRDVRAPNLFELYAPTTLAPSTIADPLTGIGGSVPVATVSNRNLTPERARSYTAGLVWQPGFARNLSFTVDGFWIKVDNAISQIAGNSASLLQLCNATAGANPACAATIVRPFPYSNKSAANFPTMLYQNWLNIASFKTYGVDFEANYTADIGSHRLLLRALASYQPHLIFDQGPAGVIDLGGVATGVNLYPAVPSFKYTLIAQFGITRDIDVTVLQRGRNALKAAGVVKGQPAKIFIDGDEDPATTFTNVTLSFKLRRAGDADPTAEFYINVQNLFNKQPNVRYPGANTSPGTGLFGFFPPNGDDIVGRYFTVGVRAKF